jgi:ankyrin repeat protein
LQSVALSPVFRKKMCTIDPRLSHLSKAGDHEAVEKILEHGTPSLAEQRDALLIAAKSGNEHILQVLLDYAVPVNLTSERGTTALMQAAHQGHNHICTMLLEAECSIDIQNDKHKNALMVSILAGHSDITMNLLGKGANTEIREGSGRTVLYLASSIGRIDLCRLLLNAQACVDARTHSGMTPLMAAARGGHTRVCELLIEQGDAEIGKEDQYGRSALIIAAAEGKTETCRLLTMHGANVNSQSSTGITALMAAIDSANQECVKFFLDDQHADVSLQNSNGANALSFAAKRGYVTVCRSLLQRAICVESANNRGTTALMVAANNGHLGVCRLLLENGADAKRKNSDRANAIDCAATRVVGKFLLRWIGEDAVGYYSQGEDDREEEHEAGAPATESYEEKCDEGNWSGTDEELARKLQEKYDEENSKSAAEQAGRRDSEEDIVVVVGGQEYIPITEAPMEEKSDAEADASHQETSLAAQEEQTDLDCSEKEAATATANKMRGVVTERNKLSENFRDALQSDEVADDLESRFKAFYEVCERRGEDDSPVQNVEKKKPLSPKISKELQAFICPITQDIMNDPVTCMDGHTYEKEAIQKWLADHDTSPLTGAKLPSKHLIPNFALRSAIDEAGIWNKK